MSWARPSMVLEGPSKAHSEAGYSWRAPPPGTCPGRSRGADQLEEEEDE